MRVFAYLDNLLLAVDSREQAVLQTQALVSYLWALGFVINLKKSSLISENKQISYLGLEIDSVQNTAMLSV